MISTFLLSSAILSSTIVGTSYASQSQAQVQSPQSTQASPTTQAPRPPTPICNPNSPPLQPGSTGAKVAELQRVLIQIGYGSLVGQADGKFGTSIQNVVKKFQQENRLPVDGKVGPITWRALCSFIPNSFIVQLKSTGPSQLSPGSTREIVGMLTPQLAEVGGGVVALYDQFGMFNVVFEGPPANREQFINSLRAHPAVQGIFNDKIVTINQVPSQRNPTGIDRVDADLSAAISGDKVGSVDADIAVLDTGVSSHPDLNIYRCISFLLFFPIRVCNDGVSQGGHGTEVAGIAAAKDNNIGVVGTAPGARIWALKVVADSGYGDTSDVMEGLNYVSANAKEIEVANLSFGEYGFSFPVFFAVNNLVSKGVVVVVAAGNDNLDATYENPANTPTAITVSAITDSDGKCGGSGPSLQVRAKRNPDDFFRSTSNYGSVVDIAAPGSNILTTNNVGGYGNDSGTSMAAPHVAGAVALIKSLYPAANPFQVDAFLKSIGTKAPATRNPLLPCDGAGRGYFNDDYLSVKISVLTDEFKEPLLHMGGIK